MEKRSGDIGLKDLSEFFAGGGDEETRHAIRLELEQSGSDLGTFIAKVTEVSRDWLGSVMEHRECSGRNSQESR